MVTDLIIRDKIHPNISLIVYSGMSDAVELLVGFICHDLPFMIVIWSFNVKKS